MKLVQITEKCIENKRNITFIAEYHPVNFIGDAKTHYKFMGFDDNEICQECTLDNYEKYEKCLLYKKAMNHFK